MSGFLQEVVGDVTVYTEYGKRKTAIAEDVFASLRRRTPNPPLRSERSKEQKQRNKAAAVAAAAVEKWRSGSKAVPKRKR